MPGRFSLIRPQKATLLLSLLVIQFFACSHQTPHPVADTVTKQPAETREIAANWSASFPFRDSFDTPYLAKLIRRAAANTQRSNHGENPGTASDRAARLSLAARIARHWFNAIEANQQLKLAHQATEVYLKSIKRIREGYRNGANPIQDLKQARGILANAKRLLTVWERRREQEVRALQRILAEIDYWQQHITSRRLPKVIHPVPPHLSAVLLERRSDLIAAEQELQKIDERLLVAAKEWLAKIHLTDGSGHYSIELNRLTNEDQLSAALMASITASLSRSAGPAADSLLDQADIKRGVSQYAEVVLNAFRKVKETLAESSRLAAQERTLQKSTAKAAERHRTGRSRAKRQSAVGQLERQRQQFSARSTLLQVQNQRLQNRIDLHLLLGGEFASPENEPMLLPIK